MLRKSQPEAILYYQLLLVFVCVLFFSNVVL